MNLEIDAAALHGMLTDLDRTTSRDARFPNLSGPLLHTAHRHGQPTLVGTATDRHTIGQADEPATGHLPATLLDRQAVTRLLAILKPHRKSMITPAVLHHEQHRRRPALRVSVGSDEIRLDLTEPETFPTIGDLTDVVPAGPFQGFAASVLEPFVKVAARRRQGLALTFGRHTAGVVIGGHYRGVLLAQRGHTFSAPEWFDPSTAAELASLENAA